MAESENSIDSRNKLLCLLTESIDVIKSGVILKYYVFIYTYVLYLLSFIFI